MAKFKARTKSTKPKKAKQPRARKSPSGNRSNAWRAYVGGGSVSNAPLPD